MFAGAPRRGFTLTEILVAITIMLMITAAAIPVVLPALEGRRSREAARILSVALDTARSKAMETGRPVGVMFERAAGNPHFCQTISYCEVPPPYTGDTQTSGALLDTIDPPNGDTDRKINAVGPATSADTGWTVYAASNNGPLQYTLIQPGDLIQFENTGPTYRLSFEPPATYSAGLLYPGTGGPLGSGPPGTNGAWHIGEMLDSNAGLPTGEPDTWWMASSDIPPPKFVDLDNDNAPETYVNTTALETPRRQTALPGLRYRVTRGPVKSSIPALQMPEDMVVDLMSSGVTELLPWTGTTIEDAAGEREDHDTFFPLQTSEVTAANDGTRFRSYPEYPSDPPDDGMGAQEKDFVGNTATQPLIVLFSPDGALGRIYHWIPVENSNPLLLWMQGSEDHQGTLYLLTAKREQMPTSADLTSATWPTVIPRDSWRDTENLWVTVSSNTGKIDIQGVSAITQGGFDPKVTDYFDLLGSAPRTLERLYLGLWLSRAGCREASGRGGQ